MKEAKKIIADAAAKAMGNMHPLNIWVDGLLEVYLPTKDWAGVGYKHWMFGWKDEKGVPRSIVLSTHDFTMGEWVEFGKMMFAEAVERAGYSAKKAATETDERLRLEEDVEPKKIHEMTSHELAVHLLTLPDLPVGIYIHPWETLRGIDTCDIDKVTVDTKGEVPRIYFHPPRH